MDVRWALAAVRSHWLVVVLTTVLVTTVAAALTMASVPVYTATARAFVSVSAPETRQPYVLASGSQYVLERMSSYAQMGTTARVLEPVISSLQLEETPPTLAGHVVSQSRVKTAFIDVSVEYNDPALAARIADTAARQLGTTMEQLENGNLRVVVSSPAAMPMAPSNHRLTVNLLFGAASGLILGIAIALLLGLMSVRLGRTTGKR